MTIKFVMSRKERSGACVQNIIEVMKKYFGELTIIEGNRHSFLGMDITITKDRNIKMR